MFQGVYTKGISKSNLTAILADWKTLAPQAAILALVPEAEKATIQSLQAQARRFDLPLMGAVFPALLTEQGFQISGMILFRIDSPHPWRLVDQLADDAPGLVHVTDFIDQHLNDAPACVEPPTLFLIFDGLLPNISTLLHRLYLRLGQRVQYAGVNAGSETFQPMPCLFDQDRIVQAGCIALLIPAAKQFVIEHGYPVTDALFRATSTTGNRIEKIDGKPALAVYQALLKSEFGIDITPDNFYQYAVHYPFGLVTLLEVLVRIPVGLTTAGEIYCVGEVPANSILKLLHAPQLADSRCVEDIAKKLQNQEAPLVAFYCAGRRMHFGGEAETELRELLTLSHASALLGALSLGEISTDTDLKLPTFHNAALVCVR
ncbi:MAG: FIST N-terminal domain-containing protein [Dechloromonas sp.]|nr:FIST N-terminal domain-containing protein [Dechloromonas sp.]